MFVTCYSYLVNRYYMLEVRILKSYIIMIRLILSNTSTARIQMEKS